MKKAHIVAIKHFYKDLCDFCEKHNLMIELDSSYSFIKINKSNGKGLKYEDIMNQINGKKLSEVSNISWKIANVGPMFHADIWKVQEPEIKQSYSELTALVFPNYYGNFNNDFLKILLLSKNAENIELVFKSAPSRMFSIGSINSLKYYIEIIEQYISPDKQLETMATFINKRANDINSDQTTRLEFKKYLIEKLADDKDKLSHFQEAFSSIKSYLNGEDLDIFYKKPDNQIDITVDYEKLADIFNNKSHNKIVSAWLSSLFQVLEKKEKQIVKIYSNDIKFGRSKLFKKVIFNLKDNATLQENDMKKLINAFVGELNADLSKVSKDMLSANQKKEWIADWLSKYLLMAKLDEKLNTKESVVKKMKI